MKKDHFFNTFVEQGIVKVVSEEAQWKGACQVMAQMSQTGCSM